MRKKRVWRYYCDHCGRGRCHAGSISEHERHCTKNPNRECGMCEAAERKPKPVEALRIALIDDWGRFEKLAHSCPACMLAAIRQSDHTSQDYEWDYNAACEQFWKDLPVDMDRREEEHALTALYIQ